MSQLTYIKWVLLELTTCDLFARSSTKVNSFSVHALKSGGYILCADVEGRGKLVLASTRDPYRPRIFKTISAAVNQAAKLGHPEVKVNTNGL